MGMLIDVPKELLVWAGATSSHCSTPSAACCRLNQTLDRQRVGTRPAALGESLTRSAA